MADEFENINSRIPDLSSALAQRIASKSGTNINGTLPPPGTVDPYKIMLKRKQDEIGEVDPNTIQKWPDDSVKKLQDYCNKMGIYGYNSGRMNPLAALALLKKQFGDDYTDVPLEQRVPEGYEKRGTPSGYGPNYPYTQAMNKKQIIHG
jgi:hypothetical protein